MQEVSEMNPVAMHEVNKARHQDLERLIEAQRQASAGRPQGSGFVHALLEKLSGLVGKRKRTPESQPGEKRSASPAAR